MSRPLPYRHPKARLSEERRLSVQRPGRAVSVMVLAAAGGDPCRNILVWADVDGYRQRYQVDDVPAGLVGEVVAVAPDPVARGIADGTRLFFEALGGAGEVLVREQDRWLGRHLFHDLGSLGVAPPARVEAAAAG